jgi:hypothetical protein
MKCASNNGRGLSWQRLVNKNISRLLSAAICHLNDANDVYCCTRFPFIGTYTLDTQERLVTPLVSAIGRDLQI